MRNGKSGSMNKTHHKLDNILSQLNSVLLGKPQQIKLAVTCLLANGHLLIEDLPGMGKTSLSHALAIVFGLDYQRIQFTSDALPADLIGVSIFNQQTHKFQFHPGPIFNQVILGDEINRANPKTQSALLEAMEELQVSVDGETYTLPDPFFVIATQNPLHQTGTYPLPESQLDRFLMRISIGFPPFEAEMTMLKNGGANKALSALSPVLSGNDLIELQQQVQQITITDTALQYIMRLIHYSRQPGKCPNPLSPRAGLALVAAAKAYAYLEGFDYVTPDHIKSVFSSVAEHRFGNHSLNDEHALSTMIINQVDPLL